MLKKFDFRALSIGALIYFVGSFILTAIVVFLLVEVVPDNIDLFANDRNEFLIEWVITLIVIFLAVYYTQRLSRIDNFNQGFVLGIILFIFNLPGTLNQIGDPKGDPFLWNFTYDISLILFSFLGSRIAIWKTKRKNVTE